MLLLHNNLPVFEPPFYLVSTQFSALFFFLLYGSQQRIMFSLPLLDVIAGDGIDVWSNLLRANLLLPVLCFYSLCEGEGLHSLLCLSYASARAAWCLVLVFGIVLYCK